MYINVITRLKMIVNFSYPFIVFYLSLCICCSKFLLNFSKSLKIAMRREAPCVLELFGEVACWYVQ